MRVYIKKSNHIFWSSYSEKPPVKYVKHPVLASLYHSFNRAPNFWGDYIIDFEHILHLSKESRDYDLMLGRRDYIKRVIKTDRCRALIGPTSMSLNICKLYFEDISFIEKKFIKLTPAIEDYSEYRFNPIRDTVKLLFVGNKFWGKGGHVAIEIARKLEVEYPNKFKLTMVCNDVPKDFALPDNVNVLKVSKMSNRQKDALFSDADIFLFPVLHDSFGVHLECLRYGLPMVTTNIYDKSEIVKDGKTGYLHKPPMELYGPGFGEKWKSWGDFLNILKAGYLSGMFDPLIDDMKNSVIQMVENGCLEEFSFLSIEECRNVYSIEKKNQRIKEIYSGL